MEKIQNTISMRQIQRNYKKIFEKVEKIKKPLLLTRHNKPKVVVLDIETFQKLKEKAKRQLRITDWKKIYQDLDQIVRKGRKNVNLAEFIIRDRESH